MRLTVLTKHPNAPVNLASPTQTATTIDLTWDAVSHADGIQNYNVYQDGVLVGSPTANSYQATGLTASTSYSFEASAVSTNGNEGSRTAALVVSTTA